MLSNMERFLILAIALLTGCANVLANNINGCSATSTIICTNIQNSDQTNSPCQHYIVEFHNIQKPADSVSCNAASKTNAVHGLTEINGGFYYFHTDVNDKKNWHEAFDYCKSRGMDLVTIESEEESNALVQKINELLDNEPASHDTHFWIGLNDQGKKGEHHWASTGTVADYTLWHAGEPSSRVGDAIPENCVHIWKYFNNVTAWNDMDCAYKGRFICQY